MSFIKKCPVCKKRTRSTIFEVEKFPYFTAPVRKKDKGIILSKHGNSRLEGKLTLVICNECSHIYLKNLPRNKVISDLYANYYSYPSALKGSFVPERDNAFLKVFIARIRDKLNKDQRRVLEIGCYDGYVLFHLKKGGFEVTGCDPSDGAQIGKKFGIDIKKRFFSVEDFLKEGSMFDIIIFRHFLEHLSHPINFLKRLKPILKDDGKIIFEVPNVAFYLRNGNPTVFSFQHLQYFSKGSIGRLLQMSGLRLEQLIETGENLIVVCSAGKSKVVLSEKMARDLSYSFKCRIERGRELLWKIIRKYYKRGIALWGAGGFSSSVLEVYGVPTNKIKFIVDSDKNKWDMRYLKHNIPIKSHLSLKDIEHDCLMVCSMYSKGIIKELKLLNYNKPIINLYPKIKIYGGQDV